MSAKSLCYSEAYSVVLVRQGVKDVSYKQRRRNMSKNYDPFTKTYSVTRRDHYASPRSRTTPPPQALPLPPLPWITSQTPPPLSAATLTQSGAAHKSTAAVSITTLLQQSGLHSDRRGQRQRLTSGNSSCSLAMSASSCSDVSWNSEGSEDCAAGGENCYDCDDSTCFSSATATYDNDYFLTCDSSTPFPDNDDQSPDYCSDDNPSSLVSEFACQLVFSVDNDDN